MENQTQPTQEQPQTNETPVQTQDAPVDSAPVNDAPVENTDAPTDQPEVTEDATPTTPTVTPVKIGEVTVTDPITSADVLKSSGTVEITNTDGSKSQYSREQALARVAESQALVEQLGGLE